jgi:hypothetical protein
MNPEPLPTLTTWQATSGTQMEALLAKQSAFSPEAKSDLERETKEIIGMCGSPVTSTNADTGLVIGYVQSGKTLSFTSLIAMARDNSFQILVVLAGISNILVDQSDERLLQDLQVAGANLGQWRTLKNPVNKPKDKANIHATITEWQDTYLPVEQKRTLLITVMKNPSHLKNLVSLFEELRFKMSGVPVLIVDDEADQASMNTEAAKNVKRVIKGESEKQSTIYSLILALKAAIPHHTLVQYTATPQAQLFIRREDELSPNFVKLLEPGPDYTGGETFFIKEAANIVREIPEEEIDSDEHPLDGATPSLIAALRLFFLSQAADSILGVTENRSMMVHPSHLTDSHQIYTEWVESVHSQHKDLLRHPNDPDYPILVDQYRETYADLKSTVTDLPTFEQLLARLPSIIAGTQVRTLNSKPDSVGQIDWNNHKSFIIIGGMAMDRGFTVKGLTVTYMPRGLGGGNADNLQQRARFFGYKKKYLGYCRVYLSDEVSGAFRDYVTHEQDLRSRIRKVIDSGRPLNELERRMLLPSSLPQPTRSNILSEKIFRANEDSRWLRMQVVHGVTSSVEGNKLLIESFYNTLDWKADQGHESADCALSDLLKILQTFNYLDKSDYDAFHVAAYCLVEHLKKHPNEKAKVFWMTNNGEARTRKANSKNRVALFQGQNPANGKGVIKYKGDSEIGNTSSFTMQIHKVRVTDASGTELVEKTYGLALWVPDTNLEDFIMQF